MVDFVTDGTISYRQPDGTWKSVKVEEVKFRQVLVDPIDPALQDLEILAAQLGHLERSAFDAKQWQNLRVALHYAVITTRSAEFRLTRERTEDGAVLLNSGMENELAAAADEGEHQIGRATGSSWTRAIVEVGWLMMAEVGCMHHRLDPSAVGIGVRGSRFVLDPEECFKIEESVIAEAVRRIRSERPASDHHAAFWDNKLNHVRKEFARIKERRDSCATLGATAHAVTELAERDKSRSGTSVSGVEAGRPTIPPLEVQFLDGAKARVRKGHIDRMLTGAERVWMFRQVVEAGHRGVTWEELLRAKLRKVADQQYASEEEEVELASDERKRKVAPKQIRIATSTDTLKRTGNRIREDLGSLHIHWEQDKYGAHWNPDREE